MAKAMIEFKLQFGTMCLSCGEDIAQGEPAYAKSYEEIADDGRVFCANCMDDPSISIEKVVKIDLEGRFIFFVDSDVPADVIDNMSTTIREWWESGDKFLWATGELTLVRISDDGEAEVIHTN